MRPAILVPLAAATLACGFLPAFPDSVLDYRIDRPRVLAIRTWPQPLLHGTPAEIDALAVAPRGVPIDALRVELCGAYTELPVFSASFECFGAPELVDLLSREVPFSWDPPDLSGLSCPDLEGGEEGETEDVPETGDTAPPPDLYDCASQLPLRVAVEAGGEVGYGGEILQLPIGAANAPIPETDLDVPRSLVALDPPRAGEDVALAFSIDTYVDVFRWYVDDGTLLGTGRTAPWTRTDAHTTTGNTLRIPDDWHGPLRVFVVVVQGDATWESIVLEVP